MNILHYSLGVYPDRQGGLVRYSTELAREQGKSEKVFYLIPGKLGIVDRKLKIVKANNSDNFDMYRIENALPIPLFAGIKNIELYTKSVDKKVFETFFRQKGIDIIHIHTLMGLHIEFLQAAKDIGIPILLTTHDFFGLCPITTLYKNGGVCACKSLNQNCFECSQGAHGYYKLAVGQSKLYKKLKGTLIVGKLRKGALGDVTNENMSETSETNHKPDYSKLDKYYKDCFSLVNTFLFNSKQTREVYESRLTGIQGEFIPLLLPTICDCRKPRQFMKDGILRVGYMGECKHFKGYYILKNSVETLKSKGYKVELDVYNDTVEESDGIIKCGHYSADNLDDIYDKLDIIVVPSIWWETLSFITIEALAGGMPCIVSDHVGAKDYIRNGENGFIVKAGSKEELMKCLSDIISHPDILYRINNQICIDKIDFSFKEHCKKVMSIYAEKKDN